MAITRNGRGERVDEGPGSGRMAHQFGEGKSALTHGPGPRDLSIAPSDAPEMIGRPCICGGLIESLGRDRSSVETAVSNHNQTALHGRWRTTLAQAARVSRPQARTPRKSGGDARFLPIDDIHLLQEHGPGLAPTFGIRPLRRS